MLTPLRVAAIVLIGGVAGAGLDLVCHVQQGVLYYPRPEPGVFGQPWWVAPQFGVATLAAIVLSIPFARAAAPRRRETWISPIVSGMLWLVAAYLASGLFRDYPVPLTAALGGLFVARIALRPERGPVALWGIAMAIGGVAYEIAISRMGYFLYARPDWIVPMWLPGVYLHAAPLAIAVTQALDARRNFWPRPRLIGHDPGVIGCDTKEVTMQSGSLRAAIAALALVLLADARPAAAQMSPFVMGDLSSNSWVGGEIGAGVIDADDTSIIHLAPAVDWALNPRTKIFGRLPLARAENDFFDGSGLGNVTVGGRMLWPTPGSANTWSAYASVSLPTASDNGDSGTAMAITSYYDLPHDAGWWAPNTSTARVGGDFGFEQPSFFFQAELGLHFLFIDNQDDALLLKYGLGGGVRVGGSMAIVGELSGYSDALDDETFGNEDTVTSLDLGLRWRGESMTFGGRLYIPLDEFYRDDDVFGLVFDIRAHL